MPGVVSPISNAFDTGLMGQPGLNNGEPYEKEIENSKKLAQQKAISKKSLNKNSVETVRPLNFQNLTNQGSLEKTEETPGEKAYQNEPGAETVDAEDPRNESARLAEIRNRQKKQTEVSEEEQLSNAFTGISSAKIGTARILFALWRLIPATVGLILPVFFLWVHIHWFCSILWSKVFCALGEEWFLAVPVLRQTIPNEAVLRQRSASARTIEKAGIIFIDLAIFFLILGIWAIITWIANLNLWEQLQLFGSAVV